MSDNKRRWFQVHLSTAIVMMFVAGGMMWVNFGWARTAFDETQAGTQYAHGWPVEGVDDGRRYYILVRDTRVLGAAITVYDQFGLGVIMDWILPNCAAAIGIVGAAGYLLEWRIRRREGRER